MPLPRATLSRPRRLPGAVVALLVAPLCATLGAQPTTITFDELAPPAETIWRPIGSTYVFGDYRLTCMDSNTGTTCATLGVIGAGAPAFPGSPAFFNNNLFGATLIARTDGAPFDLVSIVASPFSAELGGNVVFEALLADGTMRSQTITLAGAPGSPQTFTFSDALQGASWVRFGGNATLMGVPVIDQIALRASAAPSVVPEPATVALLAGGLLALGGVRLARRRTAD